MPALFNYKSHFSSSQSELGFFSCNCNSEFFSCNCNSELQLGPHSILLKSESLCDRSRGTGKPRFPSWKFIDASRGTGMSIQGGELLHCALPGEELVLLSSSFSLSDEDSPIQTHSLHPHPQNFSLTSPAASWQLRLELPTPHLTPVSLSSLCLPFFPLACGVGVILCLRLHDCLLLTLTSSSGWDQVL